jgi:hypothetical protein
MRAAMLQTTRVTPLPGAPRKAQTSREPEEGSTTAV